MLVSEKQMQEGDGVFISSAHSGLGYQLIGAFQRLGRRMESYLAPEELESYGNCFEKLPIKILTKIEGFRSKAAIFIATPNISLNQTPSDEFFEISHKQATALKDYESNLHEIWVLPWQTSEQQLKELRHKSPKATVLLVPAAYGFRDGALFEESHKSIQLKPHLWQRKPNDPRWELPLLGISYYELAGHLITMPQNEKFFGATIWVEAAGWTLNQWRKQLVESFPVEGDLLSKWAAKFNIGTLIEETKLQDFLKAYQFSSEQKESTSIQLSSQVFPSPHVQLARGLQLMGAAYQRHPEIEMVFTPSRSP